MTLRHRLDGPEGDVAPAPEPGRGRPVLLGFGFLLFLAGAAVVVAVLAARTAGFRGLAEKRIFKWTQTRVSILGSRAAWPCDLVLTDLIVPADRGLKEPGMRIPEVRAHWRPRRGLTVRLLRPAVRLVEQADGAFAPDDLAALGEIRRAADVAAWLEPVRDRASIRIVQGTLQVETGAGKPVRRLEGIDLDATPVLVPGRGFVHFRLRAGPMAAPGGQYGKLAQEWLAFEGTNLLEIAGDIDGAAGCRDYWKGGRP